MIRAAINIESLDIKDLLIRRLELLDSEIKISDYHHDNYYDVYFMEITNKEDINKLTELKKDDYQQVIILIGPEDIELIKEGYKLEPLAYLQLNQFNQDLNELLERFETVIQKRFKIYIIQNGTSICKVRLSSIKYVESYKHYLYIHTTSGEYVERKKISDFVAEMAKDNFIQIHKSYAVNIKEIDIVENSSLRLIGGVILPIGSIFKKQLFELLSQNT